MATPTSFAGYVLLALVCGGCLDSRSPTGAATPAGAIEATRSPALPAAPQKTVLILHSYAPGLPWTDALDRGLRAGLDESRYDLDIRVEFMDAKRYAGDAWQEGLVTLLAAKYAGLHLDLVIAADDAALEFVMRRGGPFVGAAPVVFCGINDATRARDAVRLRMTGVIEVLSDEPMVELALRLYPGRTRLIVIGDNTDVARAMLDQFRRIAPRYPALTSQFIDGRDVPFEAILQAVRDAGPDSLVFASAFTRDSAGRAYRKDEANARLAAASRNPVFSPLIDRLGQGIFAGSQNTGDRHGELAATFARRILDGADPAALPALEDHVNRFVFDREQLRRWGIDSSALPPGSEIANQPDSFYARYARLLWGGGVFILAQAVVIGALVVSTVRRRGAELRIKRQAEDLRAVNRDMEAINADLQGEIAERRRAEAERETLAGQLNQSQKMEAVGQLAGGVAHDFNNLLSVILGHAGLAIEQLDRQHPLTRDLEQIQSAGERAAGLTRQLLAFSRKQVLQPRSIDLNQTTSNVASMLRRLIGEDVELRHIAAANLGLTLADPGQIEQVLLNLAVNARDAMPTGGTLTIETSNAELDEAAAARCGAPKAGSYVLLAVTDTGCGMDEGTRARIFEPFFTTKEKGRGTGLGLSMVYGVVKQSDGAISVASTPGRGTRFEIYLPRGYPAVPAEPAGANTRADVRTACTETILVVEDEEAVRDLARRILSSAGYTVITSANGLEALDTCRTYQGHIHLVLTDVIMPKMGGKALVEQLAQVRPSARVLHMSGHTDNAIAERGVLPPGTHFLGKPFSPAELAAKVRQVLDQA